MFTGIIESLGKVESLQSVGGDVRLRIQTDLDMSDVHLGDSIATNGICLTVIEWGETGMRGCFAWEFKPYHTLGQWKLVGGECWKGDAADHTFWGHIVSGHVDGLGEITWYVRMHVLCILRSPRLLSWQNIWQKKVLWR